MGGCANSKYAVDEESKQKQPGEHSNEKKAKKPLFKKLTTSSSSHKNGSANGKTATAETDAATVKVTVTAAAENGDVNHQKDEIEFIDTAEKSGGQQHQQTTTTTTTSKDEENEEAKKEVTTYQTTVVKHTQKEGDELLQHLKDEAFRSLQNSLKQLNSNTTKTTTASSGTTEPQTAVESTDDDLIGQVKTQVGVSLGKNRQAEINAVIDAGVQLIKDSKVKNMTELQAELEKLNPKDTDLVTKVRGY